MFLILSSLAFGAGRDFDNAAALEAGYAYTTSTRDLVQSSPHGLVTSFYYGYTIHNRTNSRTLLTVAAGYDLFPGGEGTNALHNMKTSEALKN